MAKGTRQVETTEDQPATTPKKFKYPVYDLWQVDAQALGPLTDDQAKSYKLMAIKKLRTGVKIEKHVADSRNSHSHNTLQRYYTQDSITNGNEETVTVK